MSDESDLVGCFVVEVGVRQAWPFLTFCDNAPTPSVERRLYIESWIEVVPAAEIVPTDSLRTQWQALYVLNGLTVESIDVQGDSDLHIGFTTGEKLTIGREQAPGRISTPVVDR